MHLFALCLVMAMGVLVSGRPQGGDDGGGNVQISAPDASAGDMVLDPTQIGDFQNNSSDSGSTKRNARDFAGSFGWSYAWPDAKVNYVFGTSMSSNYEYKNDVRTAISQIEAATCLKFSDITYAYSGKGAKDSYISFEKHSSVCNSAVGRSCGGPFGSNIPYGTQPYGGKQIINMGPKGKKETATGTITYCNTGVPTVLHEIGHALGFYHEHNRWDRDNYISINWWNTDEVQGVSVGLGVLKKGMFTDYGVIYDFNSIMHYSQNSASRSGGVVFQTRPGYTKYQKVMGKATKLSFGDIKLLNLMYKCKGKSTGSPCYRQCPSEGFADRNCVCQCPINDGVDVQRCTDQGTIGSAPVTTAAPVTAAPAATHAPGVGYTCNENCPSYWSTCTCTCTDTISGNYKKTSSQCRGGK